MGFRILRIRFFLFNVIHFYTHALFLEGDTFTYADIEKNVLQYMHDGSSAQEDSLEISVTDTVATTTVEVKVQVISSDDPRPRLAAGASLSITVASKSTAIITRSHLAYEVCSYICLLILLLIPTHNLTRLSR